jgi:dolichol kinase
MLVELPLIFLLASGLFTFSSIILSGAGFQMIELGGGIAIIGFALSQIIRILKKNVPEKEKNPRFFFNIQNKKGPLLVGSALSALNPFFNMVVHDRDKINLSPSFCLVFFQGF